MDDSTSTCRPTPSPATYPISGIIGYQACEYRDDGMGSCELPTRPAFAATLNVGDVHGDRRQCCRSRSRRPTLQRRGSVAAAWADVLDGQPAKPDRRRNAAPTNSDVYTAVLAVNQYDLSRVRSAGASRLVRWPYYIALAFVGGMILNLMPCVLPVIGLKVMSFVQQAGKSRAHALVLNLWYAAGIISVFLLLGLLAATIGLSWGGQFGSTAFNVTIAAVVFAMALSLLGVWEVPIPGFFGSGAVQDAAAKEGPLGAFLKGVDHDRARHALHRPVHGHRNRLGRHANRSPRR